MLRASRLALAVPAIALALTVSACATPAPEPTPTGFATEEEAFAAAEATYRAYVDALNRVDLSDPETFEDVLQYTSGEMNTAERKSLSEMHADGWSVNGETIITVLARGELNEGDDGSIATLLACVDVGSIRLIAADGTSQVAADRAALQPRAVEVRLESTGDVHVIGLYARSGEPTC